MKVILFTTSGLETQGIVLADDDGSIIRHAAEGPDYARAFVFSPDGETRELSAPPHAHEGDWDVGDAIAAACSPVAG